MKKIILILLLIPNLVMAEFDPDLPHEIIVDNKYQKWLDANPDKLLLKSILLFKKLQKLIQKLKKLIAVILLKKNKKNLRSNVMGITK